MTLRLARLAFERSPRAARVALAALAAAPVLAAVVATHHGAPCPMRHEAAARRAMVPLAGGRCAATGAFCVSDATCGASRCVDPQGLRALVARVAGPGAFDEDGVPIGPSLAWNGEGYGVAWTQFEGEEAEIFFARLSAAGQRLGNPVRLTRGPTMKLLPSVAASPDGYAVAWTDVGESGVGAFVQRLDRAGAVKGAATRVAAQDGFDLAPRAVWNGHDYAFAWYHVDAQSQMTARFSRLAPDGTRVGAERTVGERFLATGTPGFAFMGDAYGLGWSTLIPATETAHSVFVRIGAGGEATTPLRVATTKGQNGGVALAWAGERFGFVWEDEVSLDDEETPLGRLAFAGVTPTAVNIPRRNLTARDALFTQPTLAWTGSQYGLSYARVGGDGADVYFARVGADGAPDRTALKLTPGALGLFPSLAWSGTEFAVVWTHLGARGVQLRLARVDTNGRRVGSDVVILGE